MKRMLALMALVGVLGACDKNPVSPDPSHTVAYYVSINPQVVHMKVGDSQVFTASRDDGNANASFDFQIRYPDSRFFDLEKVANNQVKLTLVIDFPYKNNHTQLIVSSSYAEAVAQIYFY